jgi:Ribbon-helix-helix protein, copG family
MVRSTGAPARMHYTVVMPRTEVYSWRLSPALKAALEEVARARGVSLSKLLEDATREWLGEHAADILGNDAEQDRLLARAMRWVGSIRGGDPDRATNARTLIRERLRRRRGD